MKQKSILIIYTGGTIGMINNPETGALCPFNFEQISKEVPEIKEFDFNIDSITLNPLIDSSDVQPSVWKELAEIIYDKYDKYSGFVILHGTDTMAYSASALSFMLDNLDKAVVFTGSQLPIGKIRTDGKENLIAAIEIAAAEKDGKSIVPEVSILFGTKLYRGNRTTKINAENFHAFKSYNYPPLAEIGIHIHYNHAAIRKPDTDKKFSINTNFDTNIVILKIFPGINLQTIEAIINIPGLKGIVLESYGAGNAPTNEQFLEKIKEAQKKNIVIYNVTQCLGGSVDMGLYDASVGLVNYGVLSAYDITTEAATTKMMHCFGQENDIEKIKNTLISNIKGEITQKHIEF